MGEWLKQVPVKLTQESIAAIDEIRSAQPFEVGRSTVARGIIERFLSLMACGIVTFAADENNRVLSNSSRPSRQGIPADSEEFSVATAAQKKPPVRAERGVGRRSVIHGVSRRSCVGVRLASYTSFLSHSTRFSRRLA